MGWIPKMKIEVDVEIKYAHFTSTTFQNQMKTSTASILMVIILFCAVCFVLFLCACVCVFINVAIVCVAVVVVPWIRPFDLGKSFQWESSWSSIVFNCAVTIQFDRLEIDIFYCVSASKKKEERKKTAEKKLLSIFEQYVHHWSEINCVYVCAYVRADVYLCPIQIL